MSGTGTTAAVGDRWRLLLPGGWTSLPTAPGEAERAIRRTVDRVLRGKPRDELVGFRVEVERGLRDLVERSREQGANRVHLLLEPVAGVPVSASLVVAELTHTDDAALAEAVEVVLGGGEGVVQSGQVVVGEWPALRRVRRSLQSLAPEQVEPTWHTHVDYAVEVGAGELLLLVFATSTDALARPLVAMFDAVAATLHRRT